MGNVIKGTFGRKEEEIVWSCLMCGGQLFWLDEGGTISCKACKSTQLPTQEWIELALKNSKEVEEE